MRVPCILRTKCTFPSNHKLTRVIFQAHKTTSPPERPFSHYIHSHRLAAEMWTVMKNKLVGKIFFSCSFYLYKFRKYLSYGFPIINFCNPGVHYEKPFIFSLRKSKFAATVRCGLEVTFSTSPSTAPLRYQPIPQTVTEKNSNTKRYGTCYLQQEVSHDISFFVLLTWTIILISFVSVSTSSEWHFSFIDLVQRVKSHVSFLLLFLRT
jgi:hypothetical protein